MKILIGSILVFSLNAWASNSVSLIGKIFAKNGKIFVSSAPGGTPAFEIRWLKGFPTKNICYFDRDALCPDYQVFYRHRLDTKSGAILVDAVASPKF